MVESELKLIEEEKFCYSIFIIFLFEIKWFIFFIDIVRESVIVIIVNWEISIFEIRVFGEKEDYVDEIGDLVRWIVKWNIFIFVDGDGMMVFYFEDVVFLEKIWNVSLFGWMVESVLIL